MKDKARFQQVNLVINDRNVSIKYQLAVKMIDEKAITAIIQIASAQSSNLCGVTMLCLTTTNVYIKSN